MCTVFYRSALLGLLLFVSAGCTGVRQPTEPIPREIHGNEILTQGHALVIPNYSESFPGGRLPLPMTGPWRIFESAGQQFATRRISPTHTIVARVQHGSRVTNSQAFFSWLVGMPPVPENLSLENIKASFTQGRYKSVSFESSPSALQHAECNDYTVDAMDHEFPGDEGRPYPYRATGRVCLFRDRLELIIQYSEQRAASEQPLPTFDSEAADFLAGLVWDVPDRRGTAEGPAGVNVRDIAFTTGVQNAQPVDDLTSVSLSKGSFYIHLKWQLDLQLVKQFIVRYEVFDGQSRLVSNWSIFYAPETPQWNTWRRIQFTKFNELGQWRVAIYVSVGPGETKMVDRYLTVRPD